MNDNACTTNPTTGFVWLVGAGPGDPGLITTKGLRCVSEADVILYDLLSNPDLLNAARPDCELICSGKRAGQHSMKQEEINTLLGQKALEGKKVCRLKGGDPFVFGRGGEEALYLHELNVPFEIVPGVSSSIAAPAYAGIPVTHRDCTSSLRIITGHEDPTKAESSLDWKEIAATQGTLVFLMGVRNLSIIARRLMEGGRLATTPVAVISNGTLPNQFTVTGTLEDIAQRVEESGLEPPAVTVVGDVVALRGQLNWFEKRPLFGRRILVTRARAQASEFSDALQNLGAFVTQAPTIRINNLAQSQAMRQAVRDLGSVDWIVFTSVNGVDAFVETLDLEGLDMRALAGKQVVAIGPATAERLQRSGLRPDLVPERFVAEAILECLDKQGRISGQTFLLPRTEIARPELAKGLQARGARVIEVAAYETLPESALSDEVLEDLEQDQFDLVTFTSSSTVQNFVKALPPERQENLLKKVRAASIGPVTSATIEEYNLPLVVAAKASTIPALVDAIVAHCTSKPK